MALHAPDHVFEIAGALSSPDGGSSHEEDEDAGFELAQIMGAEDLIKALNPGFDSGPARPSRVARAIDQIVRATLQKIEQEDD